MNPLPCYRCGQPTWGTFGSLAYCAMCLRETRAGIRARIAARDNKPEYAVGVLRCDHCHAIREEGGADDWFDLCRHGAHDPTHRRCNGTMRRITVAELERLAGQIGGDAA